MQKPEFSNIKSKYLALGITENNIDYAIGAVIDGTKREHIIETLTADYRGMSESLSTQILDELFEANGGEFKNENRGGYLYGALLCFVGLIGLGFLIAMLVSGEMKLKFLILSAIAALFGLIKGPALLIKSFRGSYRDTDEPL
jgi:hypothetical protein